MADLAIELIVNVMIEGWYGHMVSAKLGCLGKWLCKCGPCVPSVQMSVTDLGPHPYWCWRKMKD